MFFRNFTTHNLCYGGLILKRKKWLNRKKHTVKKKKRVKKIKPVTSKKLTVRIAESDSD